MRSVVLAVSFCWAAAAAATPTHWQIERGRYLAAAGDCAACHTADGGKPYAGGRAIPTPFGTIYSSNLTPDKATGIGDWSEADFYRAMHEGVRQDGKLLYPAFPYPWYTKLSREDVDSLKAFLDSLPAVRNDERPPELPWPLSMRTVLRGWNDLFFKEGEYQPDRGKSAQWNRGAYLVEGLGHCGACHTPKNIVGGLQRGEKLQGGYGENWYSPSLTGGAPDGLGNWTVDEIVKYLKTGANSFAAAGGPMAEVVEHSTQHMSEDDLQAMAVYLKSVPAGERAQEAESDRQRLARGEALYVDQCAGCHMDDGVGLPHVFPPLKGSAVVQAKEPGTLLHMMLAGVQVASTRSNPSRFAMPAFDWKLSDQDLADLASYLRAAWGNQAGPVSVSDVKDTRERVRQAAKH